MASRPSEATRCPLSWRNCSRSSLSRTSRCRRSSRSSRRRASAAWRLRSVEARRSSCACSRARRCSISSRPAIRCSRSSRNEPHTRRSSTAWVAWLSSASCSSRSSRVRLASLGGAVWPRSSTKPTGSCARMRSWTPSPDAMAVLVASSGSGRNADWRSSTQRRTGLHVYSTACTVSPRGAQFEFALAHTETEW